MDYGKSTLGVCRKNKLYVYKEVEDWVDDETEKIGLAVADGFAVVEDRPLSKYQRRGESWNLSTDAVTGHVCRSEKLWQAYYLVQHWYYGKQVRYAQSQVDEVGTYHDPAGSVVVARLGDELCVGLNAYSLASSTGRCSIACWGIASEDRDSVIFGKGTAVACDKVAMMGSSSHCHSHKESKKSECETHFDE